MMTACEPCRWTFQVSLTLCRLYSEGVIETFDLYRPYRADRIRRVGALPAAASVWRRMLDGCI